MALQKKTPTQTYRTKVVVAGGQARNGKSTMCHLLQEQATMDGWHCQRFSFADPLKSVVRMVQQDYVNKNASSLQATSEEWKRNFGKGCFAKDMIGRLNAYVESVPPSISKILVLIDDMRFPEELAALENWTSTGRELIKVRVQRPGFQSYDRDMSHDSETILLNVPYEDYTISAVDMGELEVDVTALWEQVRS